MYYLFSDNNIIRFLKKGGAALTIASVVFMSGPAIVFAEGDTETPPEQTTETQAPDPAPAPDPTPTEDTTNTQGGDGQSGTDGSGSVIETGDAAAVSDTTNTVNTNETDTTTPADNPGATDTSTTDTPENLDTQTPDTSGGDTNTQTQGSSEGSSVASTTQETSTGTTTPEVAPKNDTATSTATTTTPTLLEDTGSTTPAVVEESASTTATTTNITVENENDAIVENDATSTAGTGNNSASGGGGSAVITTGNAFSYANVVNVVNTNILDSNGLLLLLSRVLGTNSVDLRNAFNVFNGQQPNVAGGCSLSSCSGGGTSLKVTNDNTATITNNVVVRSSTGGNTASSTDGDAEIQTGDAYAAANVVNIANTNITKSNYLLVALNNIGSFAGDIILPGKAFFKDFFKKQNENTSASADATNDDGTHSVTVSNTNNATIENNVSATADTGNNTASSTGGSAAIATGDAFGSAGTYNQANTNITGASPFLLLFRVYGSWNGTIQGLPDGLGYGQTTNGFGIFANNDSGTQSGANSSGTTTPSTATSTLDVTNANTASIQNNVQVYALTGDNSASSKTGNAIIDTGNAYAAASVANVANTNVLGRNWTLMIFNIFGDWNGNVSFGQPDLWVGGVAEQANNVMPGSNVDYTFTVSNLGDADATNVVLDQTFNDRLVSFTGDGSVPGGVSWNLGTIPAGGAVEVTYPAAISPNLPQGNTEIKTTATVHSDETDSDPSNNTDYLSIIASTPHPAHGGIHVDYTPDSDLHLTKTSTATTTINAPASVDYTIVIKNDGGPAYHSVLVDTLTNEAGDVINQEYWPLDTILANEEISVTYTVQFGTTTPSGVYTNSARVEAIDRNPSLDPFYGYFAKAPIATSTIEIYGATTTETLVGSATTTVQTVAPEAQVCGKYITTYIHYGSDNNDPADVQRLQTFLRDYEGNTDLEVTGIYDEPTFEAVKAFQSKYAGDILGTWGVSQSTGYVYYTTQKKINEIYCNNQTEFTLSGEQRAEIESYKRILEERRKANIPLPDPSQVGLGEAGTHIAAREEDVVPSATSTDQAGESQVASALNTFDKGMGERIWDAIGNIFRGTRELIRTMTN